MRLFTRSLPMVLLLSLFTALLQAEDAPDWYPFILAPVMDAGSPAGPAPATLDAPAGKHGFVRVEGNQFVFEDGTPARFWGTNLGSFANVPDHKNAVLIADRLAFFGFNAVRIHHLDMQYEPGGIFKVLRRFQDNKEPRHTRHLSARQLDRLDYLIYQLKARGIYIDMNLLVSRPFTLGDGVKDADRLQSAGKPVSLFDRKLIELQKKYAKDLLTHKNRYTGLRYSEDPSVALVEITNENSIFLQWKLNDLNGSRMGRQRLAIPPFYVRELDRLWNEWLKAKYSSPEGVAKAWSIEAAKPDDFRFKRPLYKNLRHHPPQEREDIAEFYTDLEARYFDEMKSYLKNDLGVRCPVTGIGGIIDARDVTAQRDCDFIDVHAYWAHPGFPRGWNENDFTMNLASMLKDKNLGMIGSILEFEVRDKPLTISEWGHCYPNRFAYESPALLAAMAVRHSWAGLFQFAYSPGKPFDPALEEIHSFFHIAGNPQQMILCAIGSRIFQTASNLSVDVDTRDGMYTITSDNIRGAAGFIAGRDISLGAVRARSSENGAIFLYSSDTVPLEEASRWVLVSVGEVKDAGSVWEGEKFHWGEGPPLLRNLAATVTLPATRVLKVHELDASGKRGAPVEVETSSQGYSFSTSRSRAPWFEISFDPLP